MNLRNLVLAGILLFGLGSAGYNQFLSDGTTVIDLIRNALMALVGGGGLVWSNFSSIQSVVVKQKPKNIHRPEDYENKDFECLVHLRNRVQDVQDKDGLELCAKLNDVIFNLQQRSRTKDAENTNV